MRKIGGVMNAQASRRDRMIGKEYQDKQGWRMVHIGNNGRWWVMRATEIEYGLTGTILVDPEEVELVIEKE